MASCVTNICAKNRQNQSILVKVTIDNVGVPFLRHSVVYALLDCLLIIKLLIDKHVQLKSVLCIIEAVEEEECWRQYEAGRLYKNTATDAAAAAACHGNRTRVENESSVMKQRHRQAHMDDAEEVRPCVYSGRDGEPSSNSKFWLRELDAAESADPNRSQ